MPKVSNSIRILRKGIKRKSAQKPGPCSSSLIAKKKLKIAVATIAKIRKQPFKMEDQKVIPIFLLTNVIEGFGRTGSRADLHKLRQLSQAYYKYLNPVYLELCNQKVFYRKSMKEITGQFTLIAEKMWDSEVTHIFRTMEIRWSYYGMSGDKMARIPKDKFVQICSQITTLNLSSPECVRNLTEQKPQRRKQLADFIGQFSNLKQIKLVWSYRTRYFCSLDVMELGLKNVNSDVRVEITFDYSYEETIARFQTRTNFAFRPRINDFDSFTSLDFQRMSNRFGTLANVQFDLSFVPLRRMQEMETLVTLSLKHQEKIKFFQLGLGVGTEYFGRFDYVPDRDESIMRLCLSQLSPMLTILKLKQEIGTNWNLMSCIVTDWTNLSELDIEGYTEPLEFLNHCPALKSLKLIVDQNICIFHNSQLSDIEQLKKYFSNLPLLEKLTFVQTENPKRESSELRLLFKELLSSVSNLTVD